MNLPWSVGLRRDLSESGIRYARVWIAELNVVEYVESFCSELHLQSPDWAELFEER